MKYGQRDAKNTLWGLKLLPSTGLGPPELWLGPEGTRTPENQAGEATCFRKAGRGPREWRWGSDKPRGVGNSALGRGHKMVAGGQRGS